MRIMKDEKLKHFIRKEVKRLYKSIMEYISTDKGYKSGMPIEYYLEIFKENIGEDMKRIPLVDNPEVYDEALKGCVKYQPDGRHKKIFCYNSFLIKGYLERYFDIMKGIHEEEICIITIIYHIV